jgi:hypothetical protein
MQRGFVKPLRARCTEIACNMSYGLVSEYVKSDQVAATLAKKRNKT